jgi:two-component system NarL family sensor kinase
MGITTDTEKLWQRNRELSILNVIAESLNRENDLDQALQTTLARVVELFDLHTGWIWLLHEQTGEFYVAASLNLPPSLAADPRRMQGWCFCQEVYDAGEQISASNVSVIQCTRLKGLHQDTEGLKSHASVPLYSRGKRLGILNVVSQDWRDLSPDDLRLLYTIGDLLSIAVERARLFARSSQLGAAEERNRLAREIHDTLAQGMSATALQLETADALLESGAKPEQVHEMIQRSLHLIRANIEEARRSVLDLRAAPLDGQSLAQALPQLVREMTTPHNLTATVEVTGDPRTLPLRIEAGLYRIAQEAITNVIRHASASAVTVLLNVTATTVQMMVEDDGIGFDPAAVPKGRFGLIGINERVHLLGGTAKLCSEGGEGTILEVTVPLTQDT